MKNNSFFWDIYAKLYDTLNLLEPYQRLHREVLDKLELKGGERILDAGCGTGNFEKLLSQNGSLNLKVEALDFSQAMLKRAKLKNGNHSFNFQHFDLNGKLPFPDNYFDRVVSINAVYALKNPKMILGEFRRILKYGGRLVLATPQHKAGILPIFFEHLKNGKIIYAFLAFPIFVLIGLINVIILNRGARNHYHFLTKPELLSLLDKNKFFNININSAYADQAWLAQGVKE